MCSDAFYTQHFVAGHQVQAVQFAYGFARLARCDICELPCTLSLHCELCLLDVCLECASQRPELQVKQWALHPCSLHSCSLGVRALVPEVCRNCRTIQKFGLVCLGDCAFLVSCVSCDIGHPGGRVDRCNKSCTHASSQSSYGPHFACCADGKEARSCTESFHWQLDARLSILYDAMLALHRGLAPASGSCRLLGVPALSLDGLRDHFTALVCVLADWAFKPRTEKRDLVFGLAHQIAYEEALKKLARRLRARAFAPGFDVDSWRTDFNDKLKTLNSNRRL